MAPQPTAVVAPADSTLRPATAPIPIDRISKGELVLPGRLSEWWQNVALLFAFYEFLVAPYAAFMRAGCDLSWRLWLNIVAECFFLLDVGVVFLSCRRWAQSLRLSRSVSYTAAHKLMRSSTLYWRLVPCIPMLLYPALDCSSASYLQLLWLLRLRRGRIHLKALKNNITVNWDIADIIGIIVSQVMLIHLAALLWHRAGEDSPDGWLHRYPSVAALPKDRRCAPPDAPP